MKEEWMPNSVFATDSGINKNSGGGVVSFNIAEAMSNVSDVKLICANINEKETELNGVKVKNINPIFYDYPPDPPFMKDYFTCSFIQDIKEPIDLFVTYACPFGMSAKYLRLLYNRLTKIICDLAPHNIKLSREEHLKWGAEYPYPHLNDEMLLKLYTKHLRLADIVIVHSRLGKEYVTKTLDINSLVTCIPHGIYYPDDIPPLDKVFEGEKIQVGYFGSIGFDKGVNYLLQACKPDFSITFGGGGSKPMEQYANSDSYDYSFINYCGPVDDLYKFYRHINVYVQPTVTEGFGITALEAMAYGRPVIVTEGCGVSDLIKDGKEGFVVPIRNPEAIRDKLQYCRDNPSELQRMGKEARKTAERYKWSYIQKQYEKAFKQVML